MDSNTKTEIARQYLAGRYNDDIMNDYRISKPELYKILAELKIPRKQIKKNYSKNKKCKSCGMTVTVKNARYCPNCGALILNDKEICIEKLQTLKRYSV